MVQAASENGTHACARIERADFNALIDALADAGYTVLGPTVCDGAIVYGDIRKDSDLPVGITDEQEGGRYRIKPSGKPTLFSYAVGPHSLKTYLNPSRSLVFRASGSSSDFAVEPVDQRQETRYAFIGARSCEVQAMALQDNVFMNGAYADPEYVKLRSNAFIVAVNCGSPASTCFCLSMGTGPKAANNFDLALTEVFEAGQHYFVAECGSAQGKAILERIPHRVASQEETSEADDVVAAAEQRMGRTLDTADIRDLLYRNSESPRWEETAQRCLTCANCTMVCPTCFCSTVEDTTSLSGDIAERWRAWDSCFTFDFSHIHGGSVRKSGSSRYRQWITHKLASWHDQFGASGCVGCGRCITWCPVGIDITEEVAALRGAEAGGRAANGE